MQRNTKPKFIPPLKTAASYLRSISKHPESLITDASAKHTSSSIHEMNIDPESTTIFKGTFSSSRLSLQTSNKQTRDISHLQDILQCSKSVTELNTNNASIHILPTNIPQLRAFIEASSRIESRSKNRRAHICLKGGCLENMLDSNPRVFKSFDDFSRANFEFGLPTGTHEISNLKE